MFLYIVLLINFANLKAELSDLPPDPMRYSLASCLFNISNNYFPKNDTIVIGLPGNAISDHTSSQVLDQIWLGSLFETSSWSLFIQKYTTPIKQTAVNRKRNNNYIIHTRSEVEVSENLEFFKKQSWNPHARFVVMTTEVYPEPQPALKAIVEVLWKSHVLDFLIIIPNLEDNTLFEIYTWFPYANGSCGKEIQDLTLLDTCRNGEFAEGNHIFPDKVPDKLNKCAITIRTVLWPPYIISPPNLNRNLSSIPFTEGTEIRMMTTIAEFMGATPVFTISLKYQDWGRLLDNGTATGGLYKALLTEKADLGMASLAATKARMVYLDYTAAYDHESITWCVPIASEVPKWMSILYILRFDAWIATSVSFWVIVLLTWRISLLYPEIESTTFQRFGSCTLYNFSATLSTSINIQPVQFHVRIIFIMWVVYSLDLCVAFQTFLMSKLTKSDFEHQMNSMDEIMESEMEFGYISGIEMYFEDNSRTSTKILQEGRLCEKVETCLRRIANERDFALAVPKTYLKFVAPFYYDKQGQPLIYWFKSNIVSYPIQIYSYRGYPLINRINDIVLRVKDSGLMKKWLMESFISYMKTKQKLVVEETGNAERALTFEHLQGPFILLSFGYLFSLVCFIGEVVYFRGKIWRNAKHSSKDKERRFLK